MRMTTIVVGVAALGSVLSGLLFWTLRDWEQREQQEVIASLVREKVTTLRVSLLRSMEVLHSLAALHAADEGISQKQFGEFVRGALRRQPELLALSWNPVVAQAERAAFEARARSEGVAGFVVRELDGHGRMVPANRRPEYVPVRFIEPVERNAAALGYDLNSDSLRRRSVERARDTGEIVATAPLRLAQAQGEGEGFLVLLPVYDTSSTETVEARRTPIAGFAVAVFRLADLVRETFASLRQRGIDVWLEEPMTPGLSIPPKVPAPRADLAATAATPAAVDLEIAGQRLVMHYAAGAAYRATPGRHQSWLVLIGGIVITLLGSASLAGVGRRSAEVAAANAALQEEVRVRQRAEAAAAAASAAKSDFLASMSHEIRTPLNAILGYVQLLQRDTDLTPDHRDSLAAIAVSGQHLLGLINEVLDLAKIEAGRVERQEADFDLEQMARGLAITFQPLCAEKRIGFRVMLEERSMAGRSWRHGDEGKLRQILINLIGNAIKFTSAGEVVLGIREEAPDRWTFDVIDTGQGIPPEEHAEIFKPFHQGSGSGQAGGTGLGLSIAQRQVDLLGGELVLQSERGGGSRFSFTLTLGPGSGGAPPGEPETVSGGARLAAGTNLRVLVLDDRWENRDILARMLTSAGCEVALAVNAAEVESQVRSFRPEVIFLDLLLPPSGGTNGVELARRLRRDPATAAIHLVAHTASPLPSLRSAALAAGCVACLTKPFRWEEVLTCLAKHVGARFAEQAEGQRGHQSRDGDRPMSIPAGWRLTLPAELHSRLALAAELHSTTALKACLTQLRQAGPDAQLLADAIRYLMRSYDMDGIQQLLARALSPGRPEADVSAHAAGAR
jgi:signal transduction histidine kinase/FixJ family two-component response regulator